MKKYFENLLALILILIIIKIVILSNVKNGRRIFYQIMEKYSDEEQPTEQKY
jgi:uncharacterized protein YxeA